MHLAYLSWNDHINTWFCHKLNYIAANSQFYLVNSNLIEQGTKYRCPFSLLFLFYYYYYYYYYYYNYFADFDSIFYTLLSSSFNAFDECSHLGQQIFSCIRRNWLETYWEPSQTSMIECSAKIVNDSTVKLHIGCLAGFSIRLCSYLCQCLNLI